MEMEHVAGNPQMEMEHVAAPRRRCQWTDPDPTFKFIAYTLLWIMFIKACIQARLGSESFTRSRAFTLLAWSLLIYGLASGISAISRGGIHVIARWVTAVSACLMLGFMMYLVSFC